ncbi:hypothetical protein ES703_56294 [subsurface metagenome]
MKLNEIAGKIGARVLQPGKAAEAEIKRVFAGDKMSDLLSEASDTTLLVTNLVNAQVLRIAQIMDVPGICLLNNAAPKPEWVNQAAEHGTAIMVSTVGMFETCGHLYQCLYGKGGGKAGSES